MYPYLNLGFAHIGTFGLLLWFAAVCATVVLHKNFVRNGVDTDALNVVTLVVLTGIVGAKLWHELQNVRELEAAWHQIMLPGIKQPLQILLGFLHWFQAGFAWYGGLLASIAMLIVQGVLAKPNGLRGGRAAMRMLDLAAPAAAIGYGVGRIGCLTSGDGDYGINTTSHWLGVHMAKLALVPPTPPDALVLPTPIYEFLFALVLGWWLWKRGSKPVALGFLTGEYLFISGIGRFLVEFVRINPKLYFGIFSNAQMAALGSVIVGALIMFLVRNNKAVIAEPLQKTRNSDATSETTA
jgi:phosphatidylglycerol:prolipoprotein diacylglycerol transferase